MPTVREAVKAFLDQLQTQVDAGKTEATNRDYYFWQFQHLLDLDTIADKSLSELRSTDLVWAPKTNAFMSTTTRLLKRNRVPIPDEDGWRIPPKGKRERTLEKSECKRFWQACRGGEKWITKLIYDAGLRPREARELEWLEVREEKRLIVLREFKGMDQRRDGLRTRYIPLSKKACRLFIWLRKRLRPKLNDRVFTNRLRKPWTCAALRLAVNRAVKRSCLNDGDEIPCAYSFRHTFATNFIRGQKGRPGSIYLLSKILGHTDIGMTQRYCHPSNEDLISGFDAAHDPHYLDSRTPDSAAIERAVNQWLRENLPNLSRLLAGRQ